MEGRGRFGAVLAAGLAAALASCSGESTQLQALPVQSCMQCHNASLANDYSGPGIENPHPFGTADSLLCTDCHGGNPTGEDKIASHVPPPPEIGDEEYQEENFHAYFNRLTLTGIDKFPDYEVGGTTYSSLDYLQFVNPGDLRVVTDGRACGACHTGHTECVAQSLLATEAGVLSGALYAIGADNQVPANQGLFEDTAADLGFRAITNTDHDGATASVGGVASLLEFPVFSTFGGEGEQDLFQNDLYDAFELSDDLNADNSVISGSPLANLYHEQVAFTCGDCHLGSAGANNRAGDFRSSGCTACHMPYSLGGRTGTTDPNIPTDEPLDPDRIRAPERAHVARHLIQSVAKTLPSGEQVQGISDYACAGCHQGSNRTVMQYWGIRLDQNEDLRFGFQYPSNPVSFENTRNDERLFDPAIGNRTFNGRDRDQYILFEDYDGDERDDTPPDIHYEAGMGCIDCHGSFDLHGGDVTNPDSAEIVSRMEQAVAITCESCHGGVDAYAATVASTDDDGNPIQVAVDRKGNPLEHVTLASDGNFYLKSKLTGKTHFVAQTRDVVVNNGVRDPFTDEPVYNEVGSYAMGRADGDAATGIGPLQTDGPMDGFSHTDDMSCAACHAAWTNTCMGCHLKGEYRQDPDLFSNITGDRIVFEEDEAQFVYQSPIFFQLGVDTDDKIAPLSPNTETFFQWEDRKNRESQIFAFSDRNGGGNDKGATPFPSLAHNVMMPHSIRGRVTDANEGPRYCVSCHLTTDSLTTFGTQYDTFRTAMATDDFDALDFDLLRTHFGQNTGNQLGSPLWVHMVAGLGTGLFLFDENGCAINPLDQNDERYGCEDQAPADLFDLDRVAFNLDRVVDGAGVSTGSNNHPMEDGASALRDGATNPNLSGPLGATLIQQLTDPAVGIVLNSWFDADGVAQGGAAGFLTSDP